MTLKRRHDDVKLKEESPRESSQRERESGSTRLLVEKPPETEPRILNPSDALRSLSQALRTGNKYQVAEISVDIAGAVTGTHDIAMIINAGLEGYRVGSKEGWKKGALAATKVVADRFSRTLVPNTVGRISSVAGLKSSDTLLRLVKTATSVALEEVMKNVAKGDSGVSSHE